MLCQHMTQCIYGSFPRETLHARRREKFAEMRIVGRVGTPGLMTLIEPRGYQDCTPADSLFTPLKLGHNAAFLSGQRSPKIGNGYAFLPSFVAAIPRGTGGCRAVAGLVSAKADIAHGYLLQTV